MCLLLIIYSWIFLIKSNFRQFSCPDATEKGVRAYVVPGMRLFEADKSTHESNAIELTFGQLKRLIVGVVGHYKDMFIV